MLEFGPLPPLQKGKPTAIAGHRAQAPGAGVRAVRREVCTPRHFGIPRGPWASRAHASVGRGGEWRGEGRVPTNLASRHS